MRKNKNPDPVPVTHGGVPVGDTLAGGGMSAALAGDPAINVQNDSVHVYQDLRGEWRWRRVDGDNGRIVATSGEGYVKESYAMKAAAAYNPNLDVIVVGDA